MYSSPKYFFLCFVPLSCLYPVKKLKYLQASFPASLTLSSRSSSLLQDLWLIRNVDLLQTCLLFPSTSLPLPLCPRPVKSARGGHATLGRLRVPMSESVHRESPKHLHSHTPLAARLPFSLRLTSDTTLHPPLSLCLQSQLFLCCLIFAFLTVNVQQVKQPHNRSGVLSLIKASVYHRFHAPPHHQPTFPHRNTCTCMRAHIFTHIDVKANINLLVALNTSYFISP